MKSMVQWLQRIFNRKKKKSFFCFFQINHGTLKYLGSGPERDQTPCSQIILTTRLKLVMPCYLQQAGCFSTCSTNGYTFQIEMILFLTIRQMLLTTNVVIRNPQVCQSYMSEVLYATTLEENQGQFHLHSRYRKVASTNAPRFVTRLVYMHTQNEDFLIRSSSRL